MSIQCTICCIKFQPIDDVFSTYCGHIFHFSCLSQWLSRSNTCPQCRQETNNQGIHRLYLYVGCNDTSCREDELNIENIQLRIDVRMLKADNEKSKAENLSLRKQIDDLNKKLLSVNLMHKKDRDKRKQLEAELIECQAEKEAALETIKTIQTKFNIFNKENIHSTLSMRPKRSSTIIKELKTKEIKELKENAVLRPLKGNNLPPIEKKSLSVQASNLSAHNSKASASKNEKSATSDGLRSSARVKNFSVINSNAKKSNINTKSSLKPKPIQKNINNKNIVAYIDLT